MAYPSYRHMERHSLGGFALDAREDMTRYTQRERLRQRAPMVTAGYAQGASGDLRRAEQDGVVPAQGGERAAQRAGRGKHPDANDLGDVAVQRARVG